MDKHIIEIEHHDFGEHWKMTIDLKELVASAGIQRKLVANYGVIATYDEKVLSVPMTRAKKLLKLIRENGTDEDLMACDEFLRPNKRLMDYWRTIR